MKVCGTFDPSSILGGCTKINHTPKEKFTPTSEPLQNPETQPDQILADLNAMIVPNSYLDDGGWNEAVVIETALQLIRQYSLSKTSDPSLHEILIRNVPKRNSLMRRAVKEGKAQVALVKMKLQFMFRFLVLRRAWEISSGHDWHEPGRLANQADQTYYENTLI